MSTKLIVIFILISCFYSTFVHSFHDPISIIGRIKWNYTKYEEKLWTLDFKNTSLMTIYKDHEPFLYRSIGESDHNSFQLTPDIIPNVSSVKNATFFVNRTWNEYAQWLRHEEYDVINTTASDYIPQLEEAMNRLWNESDKKNYFEYFHNKSFACKKLDQNEPAVYQLIENYFMESIATQLKCYILLQLTYLTQASNDFIRYHKIARNLRTKFNTQFSAFTDNVEDIVWSLSRDIWNCDHNESYAELTNFIQGYIDNEINLNPEASCRPYCKDLEVTQNYGCAKNTICSRNFYDKNKTRCNGIVRDCDFFESSMTYCPNENDSVKNRRINFVKLESGRVLGKETFCPEQIAIKSWLHWFSTCNFCFCYCDAPGPLSDRHFSLREVVSNIDENKVLSAIKFVKKNGIIHINAIERTLLPDAKLNKTASQSVSNDSYTINDSGIEHGKDFYTLTYENRALDLDTIIGTRDELVTGVRFRIVNNHIQFQVRFTYFDELTGKLDTTTDSEWKSNSNKVRKEISTSHLDVPTKVATQSISISEKDQHFIVFGPTGWIRDMAQSTVPFIDTALVEPTEAIPLSGMGIFYKATKGFGGFVAPKLITYDFASTALRIRAAVGVYGV